MFTEISGTMWSVFLMKDGRPFQRLLLTAPSAAAAQDQARIVAGRHYRADVSDAEGVLLAICRPRNRITSFTYIPSGATPNAEQIVADYAQRNKPVVETPKSHESRTMRLPSSLIELLKERRKNPPHERWIFVNEEGRPDNHFLRKLKRIALRAGLNCGQCRTTITKGEYDRKRKVEVTCKTDAVCKHIYLHRLRKTCATRWQEHGVPIRTIQVWLGHKNLETTMIYLGVTDTEKLGGAVDTAFGD